MKHNNKPFTPNAVDIQRAALVNDLPNDLVDKIYSMKKVKYGFFRDKEINYTYDEYNLMLLGALIAKQSDVLLGRKLPLDDPRVVEIDKHLIELGISIQYHPHHGMVIVENSYET